MKLNEDKSIGFISSSSEVYQEIINGVQRDLTGDMWCRYKIGQTMELCYKMVGFPKDKYPVKEEAKLIGLNIQKYFKSLSIKEILYAFELSVHGVIHVNIEHYHTIGVKYISAILSAYMKYKYNKMKVIESKLDNHLKNHYTDYIKSTIADDKAIKKILISSYKKYLIEKSYDNNNILIPNCYIFLDTIGLINYTNKEKNEFVSKAKNINKANSLIIKLAHSQYSSDKQLAMKLAVYDYFEKASNELSWIGFGKLVASHCFLNEKRNRKIIEAKEKDSKRDS